MFRGDALSVHMWAEFRSQNTHNSWADVEGPLIPQKWGWDAGGRLATQIIDQQTLVSVNKSKNFQEQI